MENNDYFKTMQRQINFLTSLGGLQQLFDSLARKQYTDLESGWETKIYIKFKHWINCSPFIYEVATPWNILAVCMVMKSKWKWAS